MNKKYSVLGGVLASFCVVSAGLAQDLPSVIERVSTAYSIDKLNRAKTIRLESERRFPFASHEYSADFPDMANQRFHFVFDIKNERGSHEYLTKISRTTYHGRSFFKDGKVTDIFYGPDTFLDTGEADFSIQFGGAFRSSDVMLALWMAKSESRARYAGEAMWLGYTHDIVELDFPNSPELKLFVRRKDGAITKMERTLPDGRGLYYTFQNHGKSDGVLIAREHSFYIGDDRSYFSFDRDIILNDRIDRRAFDLDKNIRLEPERIDQSEMAVALIGDRLDSEKSTHQVCQDEACTTFMVVEGDLIGFGLASGFENRLQAYREDTGLSYPLKYVIAADHHDEDIGGAEEASRAGATIVVTDQTAKKWRNASREFELEVITEQKRFGDLRVLPITTDHAESVLVVFRENQKLLMQTGHYFNSFINEQSYPRQTAFSLYEAIPENIKAETEMILSGQDMKVESWSDFVSVIEKYEEIDCHRNRPICRG